MTKAELREKLLGGAVMDDLFAFRNGQDCEIFKATRFERSDDIIYIPDLEEIVGCCYTGNDFVEECGGDVEKARHLFWYCDWQHPSSALPEIEDDEEE